jgi:pimeloyl-ACP methyl ester carboxylesterase
LHFQTEGVADAELAADVRRFLRGIYVSVSGDPPISPENVAEDAGFVDRLPSASALPVWIDKDDFEACVATFERTGFTGALNYYRAMDPTWHKLPELGTKPITMPVAFIAGERDAVLAFTPARAMGPPHLTDLRATTIIPNVGHWVQQEAPAETTGAILEFLASVGR